MSRISLAPIEGNIYERAMGHRPEILEKWFELDALMRFEGLLPVDLKEEVRRSMAPGMGCVFCASLGKPRDEPVDRRESLAIAYAMMLAQDRDAIDDGTFEALREEFSEAEIVELTTWSLFMIAAQAFGHVMALEPASDDEVKAYSQWRTEGEAAATAVS